MNDVMNRLVVSFVKNFAVYISLSLLVFLVVIIAVASFGSVTIPFEEFSQIIMSRIPILQNLVPEDSFSSAHANIVMNLRLPRILLSLLVGFGLAYSGVVYQGVFRNPMAEPYLLGVSSGAALGATIASVIPFSINILGFSFVSVSAFLGALLILNLIFMLTNRKEYMSVHVLLLAGLAVNSLVSSIISMIMMFNPDRLEDVYFWTMGSFRTANYTKIVFVLIVVIITVILTYPSYKQLDIMLLGDEQAMSLGVNVAKVKKRLLMLTSFMTAVVVASCGIIGFVGLIIPHLVRIVVGPSHRKLLLLSGIFGSGFLLMSDTIARSILETKEISVGIITSFLGVPFFIWMLLRNKKGGLR